MKKEVKYPELPEFIVKENGYFKGETPKRGGEKKQKGVVIPINPNTRVIDKH